MASSPEHPCPQSESRIQYSLDSLLSLNPNVECKTTLDADTTRSCATIQTTGEELLQSSLFSEVEEPIAASKSATTVSLGEEEEAEEKIHSDAIVKDGDREHAMAEGPVDRPAEKKKKKRGSGKNRKPHPTGFEEFYADPPITPDEHAEELNEIYHHSRSFAERIQQCIQRYRARRKMDSARAYYFNQYLTLGGVDTGVKAFNGGLDDEVLETYNAKQIQDIQATDHIRSGSNNPKFYDAGDPVNWVVDFEGVVKGFLSHRAPTIFGIEPHKVKEYCGVIRNFLNYVLVHSVCPEHTPSILAARKICDLAEKELGMIKELASHVPGDFNIAASTLYGGHFKGLYVPGVSFSGKGQSIDDEDIMDHRRQINGITTHAAERIFKTAIAFAGTREHFEALMARPCEEVMESHKSFEVCGIIPPTPEMKRKFAGAKDEDGETGNIEAIGLLQVKHWDNPEAASEDMSDSEEGTSGSSSVPPDSLVESFWLEEHILERCWVGMKFSATVRELNIGVKYFDFVSSIYCSFYTYLPTERLDGWRLPVRSERPPPMVGDTAAEERDCDAGD